MSMISIKNFISPFTNTVHAVTIVLITVLFALLRLQGGGVSATFSKTKPIPVETQINLSQSDDLLQDVPKQIINSEKSAKIPLKNTQVKIPENTNSGTIQLEQQDTDLIEEFIDKKSLAESRKPAAEKGSGPAGGLDEIEKTLGMR